MRTHLLEGRKREEQVGELGNMACCRRLTDWRGGRGRSRLVSLEMWHIAEESPTGGEEEGGAGCGAWTRGTSQTTTHQLEGRKREEWVREPRNMAHHK